MKRLFFVLLIFLLSSLAFAQDEPVTLRENPPSADSIELELVVNNLFRPLYITHAGDGSNRLFILEQRGRIYAYQGSALTIFMDITDRVSPDSESGFSERGLLGLAFDPNYAENGIFFVHYSDRNGNTVLARYHVSSDPNTADRSSEEIIFTLKQPYNNHNGGQLAFGDDGYLYMGLGDGGLFGDPHGNGQKPDTLLGTILRLDVDTETGYAIPEDNPFVDGGGAPEVWDYGFRNPWRFSFDRATGDLYIADVGQNKWEEVNFEPADSTGGLNYGWNAYESTHVYSGNPAVSDVVMPIAEYDHSLGISITGGYVYRGEAIPDLQGVYLYADYGHGRVWYAYRDLDGDWQYAEWFDTEYNISSFGEDEDGEVYIVDYRGSVFKIVPKE